MLLNRSIYAQGIHEIHGCGWHGAEDAGGHADVPAYTVLGAKVEEEVFLRVVEIWLEGDAWVMFFLGNGGRTEVDAVVLCAGLEHYAGWGDGGEREGEEEVFEKKDSKMLEWRKMLDYGVGWGRTVYSTHLFCIAP